MNDYQKLEYQLRLSHNVFKKAYIVASRPKKKDEKDLPYTWGLSHYLLSVDKLNSYIYRLQKQCLEYEVIEIAIPAKYFVIGKKL